MKPAARVSFWLPPPIAAEVSPLPDGSGRAVPRRAQPLCPRRARAPLPASPWRGRSERSEGRGAGSTGRAPTEAAPREGDEEDWDLGGGGAGQVSRAVNVPMLTAYPVRE